MPSSPNYKRNYKQEYAQKGQSSSSAIKDRAKRNAARAKVKKSGTSVDGKDVDHKAGIKGGNGKSNLRVLSTKTNRSLGGKKGSKAGKAAGGRKGMNRRYSK